MSIIVFTKHAEDRLRAMKGSPDVKHVLSLLGGLEADPPSVLIRSATEALGSPIPKADIREAVSDEWRVIFTVDKSSDPPILVVLSVQKSDPGNPANFTDVFTSVITEVSSTISAVDPNLMGEFKSEPVFVPEDEKSQDK